MTNLFEIQTIATDITIHKRVTWNNGIYCNYTLKDSTLDKFCFYNGSSNSLILIKSLDHSKFVERGALGYISRMIDNSRHTFNTESDILNFKDFDSLYEFDGEVLCDYNGNVIHCLRTIYGYFIDSESEVLSQIEMIKSLPFVEYSNLKLEIREKFDNDGLLYSFSGPILFKNHDKFDMILKNIPKYFGENIIKALLEYKE